MSIASERLECNWLEELRQSKQTQAEALEAYMVVEGLDPEDEEVAA